MQNGAQLDLAMSHQFEFQKSTEHKTVDFDPQLLLRLYENLHSEISLAHDLSRPKVKGAHVEPSALLLSIPRPSCEPVVASFDRLSIRLKTYRQSDDERRSSLELKRSKPSDVNELDQVIRPLLGLLAS